MPSRFKKIAQSEYLDEIKGTVLDDFLAKGWYRMGSYIFTSHYFFRREHMYSSIWLRTRMEGHRYSKSMRKIKNRGQQAFGHTITPFTHTQELDDLYAAYKQTFKGSIPETLEGYMMSSLDMQVFDTWMVKVYEEDKLVACSLVDLGDEAMASIFAFYDPSYQSYSLGLYTMILEVEHCREMGLAYYYMGYFMPGNSRFDYKLRVGNMEFWDVRSEAWRSMDAYDYGATPLDVIRERLTTLVSDLPPAYGSFLVKNAYIDANIIEFFPFRYLEYPMAVLIPDIIVELEEKDQLIVCYDYKVDKYKLLLCHELTDVFSNYDPIFLATLPDDYLIEQYEIKKTLKSSKTTAPILRQLAALDKQKS